jgi:tetratricopeptide (TPR) repeat protein
MKLKRQSLISQGSLSRRYQTATEAWQRRNFEQAIEILERVSQLDPANAFLLLNLGHWYGMRYDYAAAERCFEKAARIAPNKTETLAMAGMHCGDFGNYAMAERFFLRAVEQANAVPKMFAQLATVYERQRRLDEAAGMVERALRLNGATAPALLVKARLERQAGRIEAAEQTIRSVVTKPNSDGWIYAQAWYELGLILDRQGKYDEAMAAFVPAKTLLNSQAGRFVSELKVVRQRIQNMRENLNVETLQCWFDTLPSLTPLRRVALLGGHPRSGTTLLEQVLDSHPDITSVEETEIFHDDAYMPLANRMPEGTPILSFLEPAPVDALQRSRANYFRSAELFLGQPIGDRLLIDKNPSLTFLIPPLLRIFPEIKLLIALRDPRDVVLSCFMQPIRLSQGSSAYLTLGRTVDEYASMMSLWQTLRPMLEGRYLEVRYEEMVNDLEPVARRTLDFLGVPWDARVLGFDKHARQKVVRSPTFADVTQPVYKRAVGRWRNYQKFLEPHLEKLEPFVKAWGYE